MSPPVLRVEVDRAGPRAPAPGREPLPGTPGEHELLALILEKVAAAIRDGVRGGAWGDVRWRVR